MSRPGLASEAKVKRRASVPKPGQLVCAAVNYLEPAHPEPGPFNAFLKSPTSIIGQGQTAVLVRYEGQAEVVVGQSEGDGVVFDVGIDDPDEGVTERLGRVGLFEGDPDVGL